MEGGVGGGLHATSIVAHERNFHLAAIFTARDIRWCLVRIRGRSEGIGTVVGAHERG